MYRAHIHSPLGPVVLHAEPAGLSGLYFVGQEECPDSEGVPGAVTEILAPTQGVRNGVPLSQLRPSRRSSQLFPQGVAQLRIKPENQPVLMQDNTPAKVVALFGQVQAQLNDYFLGERQVFSVPLSLSGTPFQKQIWLALCQVPYGEVVSYGQLGARAGLTPGHGRAVGAAVGRNPVSIIVPCHRVIGANRTLTGYSGGLVRKVGLLELEGFELLAPAVAR